VNIHEKLRLQEVKRFPICHTNKDQSVAEHSYNVTLIAMDLVAEEEDTRLKFEVLLYALEHDMDEVFTGDIPSGFKRKLRTECPAVIKLLDGEKFVNPEVKAVVKLADWLEAIYHLRHFGGSRLAEGIIPEMLQNFFHAANTSGVRDTVRLRALELEKVL
jgi:5'-deoxynucleotidase YfbR-like HD superfamily hydrolase